MPKIARRSFAATVALLVCLSAGAAAAAQIKVLCAGAMRAVLQQLAPAFEKSSGNTLLDGMSSILGYTRGYRSMALSSPAVRLLNPIHLAGCSMGAAPNRR